MTNCQLCKKPVGAESDGDTHSACAKIHDDRLANGICARCGKNPIPPVNDYCCTNCNTNSPFKL